ncbi:MAG: glycosyltransferase family 39 protein, partial [Polyangiaceae bacterium]
MRLPRMPSLRSLVGLAPALVTVGSVLVMFAAVHATFFSPAVPMNPRDEGYITAFAARMLEGHFLPYVDAVSHRGPMLYVVAALASAVGDRESFVPIRVLALGCSLLIVALTFVAAWRARRPLAGAVAALGVLVACVLEMIPDDGLAYNGEPLLDVFALAALVCLTFGLDADRARPSARWSAAAGVLAALGALSKQVGAITVVALALWPVAASIARPREGSRLQRWRPAWAYAAGAVVPPALVLVRYAAAGALRTLFYYVVTYNSRIYMAPVAGSEALHRYRVWMSDHAVLATAGVVLV